MRGTRGFVTTLEDSTGSVGESSAPSRNACVHVRSVSACAATAMIAAVIGIASTSLRSGGRHAFCSISASTSRPSRNRISTSAVSARSSTKPERGSKSSTPSAAVAEGHAEQHEDRRQRQDRAPRDTRQQRPTDEQHAENRHGRLVGGHRGTVPHGSAEEHARCASRFWANPPPGRTPTGPVAATSSRRETRACWSTAATACSPSCAASATTRASTRWSSATCTPTTSWTSSRSPRG